MIMKNMIAWQNNRYLILGSGLVTSGLTFALFAWLMTDYVPFIALGLACIIIGIVSLALNQTLKQVPFDTSLLLIESSFDTISAIVEEFGVTSKALYLPRSVTDGPLRTLIPIQNDAFDSTFPTHLDQRLIVQFGNNPEDIGILLAAPGATILEVDTIETYLSTELATSLSSIIVGNFDLATGVDVQRDGSFIQITIKNSPLSRKNEFSHSVLGSPMASITATITALVLNQPILIDAEEIQGKEHKIKLETKDA